mmetsp:Transcript_61880/g.195534  ORF Transcript_61880/g.195534 Transcript_61880/m.195534 type:complete len:205 (+) Transcript_61880:760-1374(+)
MRRSKSSRLSPSIVVLISSVPRARTSLAATARMARLTGAARAAWGAEREAERATFFTLEREPAASVKEAMVLRNAAEGSRAGRRWTFVAVPLHDARRGPSLGEEALEKKARQERRWCWRWELAGAWGPWRTPGPHGGGRGGGGRRGAVAPPRGVPKPRQPLPRAKAGINCTGVILSPRVTWRRRHAGHQNGPSRRRGILRCRRS